MPCPNTARLRKEAGDLFGIRDWFLGRHYFEGREMVQAVMPAMWRGMVQVT